ncbi:DUF1285 domain-containing protein [Parvularcula sp. LCG005]|uniref:DUF1285 domain-containing protein n=1 Tax=Parvularcula sp. LCG005 TaxID=3078805 RepID=UPI002943D634|nr:DUF1285 domain-containing protein [Parvularcula sp. LCG005]WOI52031.1 DUF1285 domain-containing protein [Parvularcula sp. LCG005]
MTDFLSIAADLSADSPDAALPVEGWHPDHCGMMDLVIKSDGMWIHEGSPIGRPALIRLFSRVLRKDDDGYVLVTPAEKLTIAVEDVPFLIVDVERDDAGCLQVRTNVGDMFTIGEAHPISVRPGPDGTAVPYAIVRGRLEARFNRTAYYQLVEMAEQNGDELVVHSGSSRFSLGDFQ